MGVFEKLFNINEIETRTDRRGNSYEYNLRTKRIKKQNPGSIAKFDIGSADSTKQFEDKVKE